MGVLLAATATFAVRAETPRHSTSLRFASAHTGMYMSSLRNAQQWQTVMESHAIAKLQSLPLYQMAMTQLQSEWQSGSLVPVREFLESPENKNFLPLVKDALAQEVFLSLGDLLRMVNEVSNTVNMASMQAQLSGEDPEKATQEALLKLVEDNPQLLQVPGWTYGFRLSNVDVAKQEIPRLAAMLRDCLASLDERLAPQLVEETINGDSYHAVKLSGENFPWEDLLDDSDLDPDVQARLLKRLKQITLTINLGMHEEFLILYLGADTGALTRLGQAPLLVDDPKMATLQRVEDKPLTSIGYVSDSFMQKVSSADRQIDQMVQMLNMMLKLAPLPPDVSQDLAKDLRAFGDDIKAQLPKVAGAVSYSWQIDQGYESLGFNWTEYRQVDGSKPLSILKHVGTSPILMVAARGKPDPRAGQLAKKWFGKVGQYFERLVVPSFGPDEKKLYESAKQQLAPLGKKLVEVNRTKLTPAMADGQAAFILDARLTAPAWHQAMPPASEPLPLPELNLVFGVSDAGLLKEGAADLFGIVQDSIIVVSRLFPDQVPPIQLPPPIRQEVPNGELFLYPLPPQIGLDSRIAPVAALSVDTLVLGVVPETAAQLLSPSPLEPADQLFQTENPLASAWRFDLHKLLTTASPWIDYVAALNGESPDSETMVQVHALLDILGCVRLLHGVGQLEDGVFVSRSICHLQDLP